MALTRFNKANTCPVCGSGTKGCSHDAMTGVHFCRGDANNPEYKRTKVDRNGLYGIYILASQANKEYTAEEKAAWLEGIKKRKERERQRFLDLDSVEDRNAKYESLTKELGLFLRHQDDLVKRGVTNGKQLGFRSVKRYQKIPCDMSNTAGFNANNKYTGDTGMLCPIKDIQGNLLGYQIKPDNGDVKYKWLTSGKVSSHLQNQELPINVAQNGDVVMGFCEGILKSTVAASIHKSTFIGASTVGSTPHQIKAVIKHFNLTEVKLFVDAGAAINRSVASTMNNFNTLVESLGLKVAVADWGHWFDKNAGDIDEIDDISTVAYKSFAFFKACCEDANYYSSETPQIITSTRQELESLLNSHVRTAREVDYKGTQGDWIDFDNKVIPTKEEGVSINARFTGLATNIYEEGIKQGYKVILDSSATGSGKTKAASEIDLDSLGEYGIDKLVYCAKSSRQVNNEVLERVFLRVPSRHNGYDFDEKKLTPLGNPSLVPSEKDIPDIPSNCGLLNLFSLARSKNLDLDICGKCEYKKDCNRKRGEGFGYKAEMKHLNNKKKLRATVAGLSDSISNNKSLLVVDEYNQTVPWIQSVRVNDKDVASVLSSIHKSYPTETLEQISNPKPEAETGIKLLNKLIAVLALSINSNQYKFGMSLVDVVRVLRVSEMPKEHLDRVAGLAEVTTGQDNDSFFEQVDSRSIKSEKVVDELLAPQWFRHFVTILTDETTRGSLVINNGVMTIDFISERILENLNRSHTVIYQDATGSKKDLATKLGIDESEILEVQQKRLERAPVVLNQILGVHQAGNRRSEATIARIEALREWYYDEEGKENVGCIDFKRFAKPGDLVHFVDGRGSNAFKEKTTVISFGLPVKNMTAVMSEYQVFEGVMCDGLNHDGFQEYLSNQISAEVIQEAGRLRANRRPDEVLEYIIVSDSNLNFMNNQGFKLEKTHIMQYLPEKGTKAERLRLLVLESITSILENDPDISIEDIKQKDLVRESHISQSRISKLAKKFGGWSNFKRVIKYVIHTPDSSQITEEDREAVALAKTYLPLVLSSDLEDTRDAETMMSHMPTDPTEGHWAALFEDLCPQVSAKFISNLITALPRTIKRDFLANLRRKYQM